MKFLKYIAAIYLYTFCALFADAQTVPIADDGFRKCIADSFPTALDPSQNLIVAKAATITKLECPNYGISSIDELIYFTTLTQLNITKNPIITLPDMSAFGTLTKLNIGETGVTSLPDFSKLPNLTYLSIHRLNLTKFPNLTNNKNLVQLLVHTNQFDSIPDLNFPKLEVLGISLVGATRLPDLSGLPKLRLLECFRNSIKQLPDMSMLDSLKVLDASTNLIEEVPALPKGIQKIYLDNNQLTKVPSFASYNSLSKVRLFKNYLSFEDLLPLTLASNFNTVYEVSPQKPFTVGTTQTIVELEKFSMDSKIDSNVSGVSRRWFFNNTATSQTARYYSNTKASLTDQGSYYCELTHPSIPALTLKTDLFNINMLPCINLSGVTYEVTGSTCVKQGTVKINLSGQPGNGYKFELEGLQTHKKYSSTTGQFLNLEDSQYKLTLSASNECTYSLSAPIEIPKENCTQLVITPNGDGIDDNYYFSQTGEAKVIDKFGNTVCQLTLPKLWDGYVSDHRIPVGYYLININNGEEVLKLSVIY